MRVARSRVVNMFLRLGCKPAYTWNDATLQGRIDRLQELFSLDMDAGDSDKLFRKLWKALDGKEEIELLDDTEEPAEKLIGEEDVPKKARMKKEAPDDEPPKASKSKAKAKIVDVPDDDEEKTSTPSKSSKGSKSDKSKSAKLMKDKEPAKPVKGNTEPVKSSKGKTDKKDTKPAKSSKPAQASEEKKAVETNRWFAKMGTQADIIDSFFFDGNTGTAREIAEATDVPFLTVTNHLHRRHSAGFLTTENSVWRCMTRAERMVFLDLTEPKKGKK